MTAFALVVLALVVGVHIGWDSRNRTCKRKHPDVFWYRHRAVTAENRVRELREELDAARLGFQRNGAA